MAFAPYSPILFGVSNDAVKAPRLCSIAFLKVMDVTQDTSNFHFKISNTQLRIVNTTKKRTLVADNKLLS